MPSIDSGTGSGSGRAKPSTMPVESKRVPTVPGGLKPFLQNALPKGFKLGNAVWQTAQEKWYFWEKAGMASALSGKAETQTAEMNNAIKKKPPIFLLITLSKRDNLKN
jgi:hypothetical protein